MYQERTYRNLIQTVDLQAYRVVVKETDLMVYTDGKLEAEAKEIVLEERGYLEAFIKSHPEFAESLEPWHFDGPSPEIVRDMLTAGKNAGVGPMAAVAGAIAERVGFGLLELTEQVLDLIGSKSEIKFEPLPEDDPRQRQPDITLAREKLGWEPTVPLRQGLEKTIDYFADLLQTGVIQNAS